MDDLNKNVPKEAGVNSVPASAADCERTASLRVSELLLAERKDVLPCDNPPWFHSDNEETYQGPFESRELAIEDAEETYEPGSHYALGRGAECNPLGFVDARNMLESTIDYNDRMLWMEESLASYWGLTKEQEADLELRVRIAMAEWIVAHNLQLPYSVEEAERLRVPTEQSGNPAPKVTTETKDATDA